MRSLTIDAVVETWPIAGAFVIARGAKREATVVVAQVSDGTITGRGECVPYARYGETVAGVRDAILGLRGTLRDRASLARQMPAGAARNALDCALWDYEAKRAGTSAARLAGLAPLHPVTTAYTISLDTAEAMAAKRGGRRAHHAASEAQARRRGRRGAPAPGPRRVSRTRASIADANEAWTPELLPSLMAVAAETGVELIEQPLPAGADAALAGVARRCRCAPTRSLHDRAGLAALAGRYDAVNIKLDKAGGLTEALALAAEARAPRLQDHGRLHGVDLARHGAGAAAGAGRRLGRPRRPAAAGARPRAGLALRGRARAPARAGAVGLSACAHSSTRLAASATAAITAIAQ